MYENIAIVPLRGLVVLPGEILHFDAGREKSVSALKAAVQNAGMIFLSSQKDPKKNEVGLADIYETGTLSKIRQVLCLPGDSVRVLVEGVSRAMLIELTQTEPHMTGRAVTLADKPCESAVAEAIRRRISALLEEYMSLSTKITADTLAQIDAKVDAGEYADAVANVIATKTPDRQSVLDQTDVEARLITVLKMLSSELEILKVDRRISKEVKRSVDQNQKEYYLREQMKAIRKELGNTEDTDADRYRDKLTEKSMPQSIKDKLLREIDRFADLPAGSHEAPSMRTYIECMLELPWTEESSDNLDLKNARDVLDADHYGLDKVKQRIVEFLAVAKLTGKLNGQIICFVGPPGVGKTSVSSSIARAIGRKFVRMSLGGIRDEAEIRGHRRTYIGAMPGRVISAMRQAGTINPVILFDEIDKLSSDYHGDPASAMLEVLDSAQNFEFRDHFLEMPYDLSKVLFITTANNRDTIPAPLLDRMEVIEVSSYLENEKLEIAKRHLLPKQLEKHGLTKSMLTVPDVLLTDMIENYTAEAGVRELERTLGAICRKAACEIGDGKSRVRLTKQRLTDYLGQPKYRHDLAEAKDAVGMANGLAWTSVGGVTLEVEAQSVPGSGQVQTTGKLGDVMQESARAALTYVRANAETLGIDSGFLQKTDIHVHVPEGAVPKDGPSAGITIMTAITSALTGIPVRHGLAMTGEITLRGRVLPIGGLREKLLAAVRAGIGTVIVPAENKRDMDEVPEEVKTALKVIYASDAETVLKNALIRYPSTAQHMVHVTDMEQRGIAVQ